MSIKLPHRGVLVAVLTTTVATSSCGGGGGGGSSATPTSSHAPIVAARPVEQTDLQIAQAIYAGTPRTPSGFYSDTVTTGHEFVATEHLKNIDIDAGGTASQPTYELCSDDWNEALGWSELNAQKAPAYTDLVATDDAEHYFEFGRVRNADPDFYLRDRVFKCAYVDRSTADLRMSEGAAGLMNHRPITGTQLRTFSEYMWWFSSYNNFGHAVLKGSNASSVSALSHTLYIASLARNGLSSSCDRIDVISWTHIVDASSGALTLDVETEFSFGAREAGGLVELCAE